MATRQTKVVYIVAQAGGGPSVIAQTMFGEYALYAAGKLVALICDDQLFLKPTPAGRACLGQVNEASPYRGAKPSFLISDEQIEDGEWLAALVRRTADDLPAPVRKPRKRRQGKKA